MKIHEVVKEAGLSKRAVKYYEEEGLLTVKKDQNGYRNYSEENIRTLKEISVYRKLGIGIKEIKKLLAGDDKDLLMRIYKEKACLLYTSISPTLANPPHTVSAVFSNRQRQMVSS